MCPHCSSGALCWWQPTVNGLNSDKDFYDDIWTYKPMNSSKAFETDDVFSPQALYDHLMDFLADRGVDNTFADELSELSTALEHQEYIKFLEDLSGFIKCY